MYLGNDKGNTTINKKKIKELLYENLNNSEALLSSDDRFTISSLKKYTEIKEWDNGYIVVMAKYRHNIEDEEEYIDLVPILKDFMGINRINDVESNKCASGKISLVHSYIPQTASKECATCSLFV